MGTSVRLLCGCGRLRVSLVDFPPTEDPLEMEFLSHGTVTLPDSHGHLLSYSCN